MMNVTRYLALIVSLFGLFSALQAQSRYDTLSFDFRQALPPTETNINFFRTTKGLTPLLPENQAFLVSGSLPIPVSSMGPFITLSTVATFDQLDPSLVAISVSHSTDGAIWSGFQAFPVFDHEEVLNNQFTSDLIYLPKESRYVKFQVEYDPDGTAGKNIFSLKTLRLDFFQPSNITPPGGLEQTRSLTNVFSSDTCGCKLPSFVTRTAWGNPDGQAYSNGNPVFATAKHAIIHHSAGSNTSSDWAAVVLAIWNFHTSSVGQGGRGWDDIGYNWLIDPNGIIYEGRGGGNDVVGAHFCGKNTGTVGICLLGTYETVPPTEAAINSLEQLLDWKFCDNGGDPAELNLQHVASGLELPAISGHKDGCSTLCPGALLHAELDSIRANVAMLKADSSCSTVTNVDFDLSIENFKLGPNPTQGDVRIEFYQDVSALGELRLRDMQGKLLKLENWTANPGLNQKQFSFHGLPSGLYLAQFTIGQRVHSQKVIIQSY